MIDPFGTAALRESVLAAWRGSPTRLREDAASEGDLVRAGYRDRLLTELAQNAADAAAAASVAGRMSVELDSERRILRLSNTGAALTATGVQAMAALRASGKEATADATGAVGRFGVGFTAVLAVADEIEVRSTSGSVRFSAADTARAVREAGIEAMVVPPALRLVWPVHTGPQAGWDTEVLLRLRGDVDPAALRASLRGEAAELLLELPALESITVDGDEYRRAETELDGGVVEIRLSGERWWQFATPRARWLLPVDDMGPVQAAPDVLRAPTRSDEELSLPALLVADVAMQPDRRRLLPGADLAELASGYADFARALAESDRLVLVPAPGFPRSAADDALRAAL
ncbi:MAG: ATP-binding protein, partial [Mycobacteriaceae bacterium]|nr:ATP-binding protein [Mycobacteriaceae bacterium]